MGFHKKKNGRPIAGGNSTGDETLGKITEIKKRHSNLKTVKN